MRAHHDNLPFPSFTRRMTIELTKHVVMFLRAFPPNSGLSKTYSPRTIMIGKLLEWNKNSKLHFGAYAQVYDDRNVTNTLEERTQGAIFLEPTDNQQGTCNLFSPRSGNKITCRQFTEVPTPKIVMKQVAAMELAKKQNEKLIFENHIGSTVNDNMSDDKGEQIVQQNKRGYHRSELGGVNTRANDTYDTTKQQSLCCTGRQKGQRRKLHKKYRSGEQRQYHR